MTVKNQEAPRFTRSRLLSIGAAVLLVAVLVGVGLFAWRQRIPPQERLRQEVQRELARAETVQGRLTISLQEATLEQELWVERPDYLRTETEAGPSGFAGTIVVLNQEEGWVYSRALNMATVVDRNAFQEQETGQDMPNDRGAGSFLERMPDIVVRILSDNLPVSQGDSVNIAGRSATHYQFVIPSGDPALPEGVLEVWLDDQYSYPLAWRDSSGRQLRFSQVDFNQEIDDATFAFFPPPGAEVRRVTPTP